MLLRLGNCMGRNYKIQILRDINFIFLVFFSFLFFSLHFCFFLHDFGQIPHRQEDGQGEKADYGGQTDNEHRANRFA